MGYFEPLLELQRRLLTSDLVRAPPQPVLGKAFKVLWIAVKHGFNIDAAKPSFQAHHGGLSRHNSWDDHFVDELKRGLYACRVL